MSTATYTFTMSPVARERLETLCQVTEGSHGEVIVNALRLYERLIAEYQAGHTFLIKKADGSIEPFDVFETEDH